DKAKSIYENLYQTNTYKDLIYDNYIQTLIKLRDYADAEKIIRKKIKEENNNFSHKLHLGQILKEKGDNNEAEKIFNDIIRTMPPDAFYISQVANQFYRINDYQLALKTFLNGRKILGNDREFAYELINIYRFLKIKDGLSIELINILDHNPEFLSMAKSNVSRTFETNEDYLFLKSEILKKLQKSPQNIELADFLAWTHIQLKEYSMALIQVIALDKRTNDNGSRVFALANILSENKAFEEAEKGYHYLIAKGPNQSYYVVSKVSLLKIKEAQFASDQLNQSGVLLLEKNYEELLNEFGKNSRTLFAVKELAKLKANVLNKPQEAELLLEAALTFNGLKTEDIATIKLDLADIYVLNNNPWEASLVLGQVEKSLPNDPLAQEAKFKNAKLSFYNGDFKWAKAQLDVLKASTSQLIANDALDLSLLIQDNTLHDTLGKALKIYARAEFLRTQNHYAQAIATLDSIETIFPNNELTDDILLSKARIYTSQNQINDAVSAYEAIINNHTQSIWADDALYSLGVVYDDTLKNKEKATAYYQKLIEDFPGSLF
ncbi:MAG TPA: tetratricopeptide repeat protein, partial [Flavobacterium sp.]|nr:tetratricopeptide repeat protein [Flavobacterium sp.]